MYNTKRELAGGFFPGDRVTVDGLPATVIGPPSRPAAIKVSVSLRYDHGVVADERASALKHAQASQVQRSASTSALSSSKSLSQSSSLNTQSHSQSNGILRDHMPQRSNSSSSLPRRASHGTPAGSVNGECALGTAQISVSDDGSSSRVFCPPSRTGTSSSQTRGTRATETRKLTFQFLDTPTNSSAGSNPAPVKSEQQTLPQTRKLTFEGLTTPSSSNATPRSGDLRRRSLEETLGNHLHNSTLKGVPEQNSSNRTRNLHFEEAGSESSSGLPSAGSSVRRATCGNMYGMTLDDLRPQCSMTRGSMTVNDSLQPDDASDDDDDDLDDATFQDVVGRHKGRNSQCAQVRGEQWCISQAWTPQVYPKLPDQAACLRKSLSKAWMFANLGPPELNTVIGAFQLLKVRPGCVVISEGAHVDANDPGVFVLDSGILDVFKRTRKEGRSEHGVRVCIYADRGEVFGELAVLYDAPRAATVVARTACTLWSIDRETFNMCVKGAAAVRRHRVEKLLKQIPLLNPLDKTQRLNLVDAMKTREYHTGQRVIRRGGTDSEFFIVETGEAEAVDTLGKVLETYGPGGYFGELALLRNEPRKCDVVARTSPTYVLALDRFSFNRLLGPLEYLMKKRAKQYSPIK